MSELDLDYLQQWVGREERRSERVSRAMVERFRATFDQGGAVQVGDAAPPMIHLCIAPPAAPTSGLGPDGHPERGGFLPPVPLPRRMWAGGALTFHDEIRVDDEVTRHSRIREIKVKEGRSGTLCFVTVDHRIDSDGRLAVEERHDIVYRGIEPAEGMSKKEPELAAVGSDRVVVEPSAVLLFRYSALTFNGHRIHYDNPYTKEVEHYPGLIVHGPLQATMLVHFAEKLRGSAPIRFEFRSLSPLFDDAPFTLNAQRDEEGLRLWTSYVDGPVAMEARAIW